MPAIGFGKPFLVSSLVACLRGQADDTDGKVGRVGYEISFNRDLYKYVPPRLLEEIKADLMKIEKEIADMLADMTE